MQKYSPARRTLRCPTRCRSFSPAPTAATGRRRLRQWELFGPGWKAPSDIRLQIRDDALVLNDNGGRSIHFEPLLPGKAVYSRSESMWLVRGGKAAQPDGHTLARLWASLPPDIRLSPHLYLATNSAQGPWWILG
ncbi:putative protein in rhs element [Shigella boydii Sb227]|uniref:Uncharacterized protein n=1 Tax=Shigella boydii serotype 4 (strain Sb227) TaxID=300268 RepID=Q324Z9_SHIBS|nr:putative protein in rhs element [Shigella boydii Sb227]